jgi:hypothetical protein
MENQQMAMPAEMAAQGPGPDEMAIYEQMRQEISPQEFSNEMLASASQVDPQAVAEFTEELRSLDVSPDELDALNDLVDQILASPEQYDQLRQQFLAQGMPDDILPEQFDPYFFAALNMAVDQMIAAPTGVQAFAEGGIAELKPIAKAIASYGRNGDTMLAHITPAEARMLRRRGGSGTINPHTGLPEFFLKKVFKSIGKAVKKFASSTVGRIVTTVALGFFLGPAAASFMGVGSAAGVAAVSGFVGSAGSTLLAGGNLKDALKAGAIGGITAGAVGGVTQGFDTAYAGPTTVGGQVDAFKGMLPGGTPPVPGAPTISGTGEVANMAAAPAPYSDLPMTGNPVKPFPEFFGDQASAPAGSAFDATASQGSLARPLGGDQPGMFDQAKDFYNKNISPSGIKQAATPAAQDAGAKAVSDLLGRVPTATPAMQETAYQTAFKSAMPGVLGTYGPAVGAGLGIMALSGGFDSKPVQGGPITQSLMKPADQRIREKGTQSQMYMQGLPGVKYDEFGAPVFGQSTPLPMYNVPEYNYGGFNQPSSRGYADGGDVQYFENGGDAAKTPEQLAAERQAALEASIAQQRAGQEIANRNRALRLAAGSGSMYANINAGISALAPETDPMNLADTTFGARNRQAQMDNLQQTYGPMLEGQRNARQQQERALGQPSSPIPSPYTAAPAVRVPPPPPGTPTLPPSTPVDRYSQLVQDQYARIGRTGFGEETGQIDTPGFNYFVNRLKTGAVRPEDLSKEFDTTVQNYMREKPDDRYTKYIELFQRPITTNPVELLNMGGIAGLAQGGYPRRNGQINGPGTEKSDSIPAMLSDGEFVMTAAAVRGAGKGSRRAGAKQMYKLMHQLEKNAERG